MKLLSLTKNNKSIDSYYTANHVIESMQAIHTIAASNTAAPLASTPRSSLWIFISLINFVPKIIISLKHLFIRLLILWTVYSLYCSEDPSAGLLTLVDSKLVITMDIGHWIRKEQHSERKVQKTNEYRNRQSITIPTVHVNESSCFIGMPGQTFHAKVGRFTHKPVHLKNDSS